MDIGFDLADLDDLDFSVILQDQGNIPENKKAIGLDPTPKINFTEYTTESEFFVPKTLAPRESKESKESKESRTQVSGFRNRELHRESDPHVILQRGSNPEEPNTNRDHSRLNAKRETRETLNNSGEDLKLKYEKLQQMINSKNSELVAMKERYSSLEAQLCMEEQKK